jgi:hypothetical protein
MSKEYVDSIVQVKRETKKEEIEKIEQINYNGKSIPLKTEKLKMIFKKVQNHLQDLEEFKLEASTEQSAVAQQVKAYLDFINILEDASFIIKKEKAEESKRSEQSG